MKPEALPSALANVFKVGFGGKKVTVNGVFEVLELYNKFDNLPRDFHLFQKIEFGATDESVAVNETRWHVDWIRFN